MGELEPKFHISGFARPYLYTSLNEAPGVIRPARWKLLPFWVKTEQDAAKYANTLNADSDTIFETKSYSHFILKYRRVLRVDGFYEPHHVEGVKETENYYIYQEEKKSFHLE